MVERKANEDEAVGYGRPPKATQFKKGQSGNPTGRPRKERGLKPIAARVLGEVQRLSGKPKGDRVRYTTLEVVVMTLKQLTASGHVRASKLYMRFVKRYATQETGDQEIGYIILPERLTREEWEARYSPKDDPPQNMTDVDLSQPAGRARSRCHSRLLQASRHRT
jgi:hypothetical protein